MTTDGFVQLSINRLSNDVGTPRQSLSRGGPCTQRRGDRVRGPVDHRDRTAAVDVCHVDGVGAGVHPYAYSVVLDLSADRGRDSYHASAEVRCDARDASIEYYVETIGKIPSDAVHCYATYRMDELRLKDFTVLETQGPIWARQHEHLATADSGVVLPRGVLNREIEKVQQGQDPVGVIRDPEQGPIDTSIDSHFEMARRFPTFTGTRP